MFGTNKTGMHTDEVYFVAVLLALHSDQRDKLQQHVHLPCAEGAVEAGPGDSVR